MTSLTLKMDSGLAAFDCPDHYATLGIPIGASSKSIRKRYLSLARSLHPDSCGSGVDKDLASLLLSKLINPAYEVLSNEKQREEYSVLLRLVGKRVYQERNLSYFKTQGAQAVLESENYESLYDQTVTTLAQSQYNVLDHVMGLINELSELNLAYLMRQENQPTHPKPASGTMGMPTAPPPVAVASPPDMEAPVASAVAPATRTPAPKQPPADSFVSQYCRRAEELIDKKAYEMAIKELKDALGLDAKSATCHSLLGTIYLHQSRPTMAKVHFNQALKINPQEIAAIKGLETLNKQQKAQQKNQQKNPAKPPHQSTHASKPAAKKSGRGLFGFFGGK
ncbi:DnaJ domain-containing protein [Synechococcales cyanobacterium C]|uniref:DnaJ domain-containing protein n=1 Tax=Petrachloros mirabilis ULC683 TaxID=2781853 RepID=A0A8K1ZZK7_9CYAN|nr:DnaJ domain-containing protein [Petrachloros mirabilis]NCJ06851.1 DnaJ domain-containing protein [Petrachloros mirabilis ULC683]